MSATQVAQPPQAARPLTDELAEAQTMRGLWIGLLIALPSWLILVLLVTAVL